MFMLFERFDKMAHFFWYFDPVAHFSSGLTGSIEPCSCCLLLLKVEAATPWQMQLLEA